MFRIHLTISSPYEICAVTLRPALPDQSSSKSRATCIGRRTTVQVHEENEHDSIQYKPTKRTISKSIFQFLIFWCLLHVSNPRVHRQEDGIYSYGMVRLTCFSISSLPEACKTCNTITVYTTVFLAMNPRLLIYVEDIKILKIQILI